MNYIFINNLKLQAKIGCYRYEHEIEQPLFFTLKLYTDISKPADSDDIKDALDYVQVKETIKDILNEKHYDLIEHLGAVILAQLNKKFTTISKIKLSINKPSALEEAEGTGVYFETP